MSAKVAKSSKPASKEPSALAKIYLIAYNAVQVGGWSYILYQLVNYYLLQGPEFRAQITLWDYTRVAVIIFQNAAFVEILNAAFGLVKSNPVVTGFQVFSRMMVVVGVVMATPTGKVSPGLPIALFAWAITEIIRYGYYALNIVKVVPHFVVFLRYTTFIALYPIGVTGELLCFWYAQSYAREHSVWSTVMPNKLNATFSYFAFLWIVMLGYIPIFPQLYLHMFAQRRKILGGGSSAASAEKKKAH
ncbi:very-long-chain (3R)-3-hydroxyacyl-CoA dehydratase hpo-8 isoform X1 [Drosophila subobscura]|uniref:very-long-chain (3R)-3-hydroxyacyl-CoA dehydratase hpo-8 isoform X1 n=1 Tax=Drosophila subobscura TaxID=7241 RepID=UPI00155A2B73|nr:very-long-chain (3R)-3-hydroxyacyl-CoA dehydratase hpo-8 isoform X1 [Drosophila subobscura]